MMFPYYAIANADLTESVIPPFVNGWDEPLIRFALSFDGYEHTANVPGNGAAIRLSAFTRPVRKAFAEEGSLPSSLSLSDLRACLFWEERAVRHNMQWKIDGKQAEYLRALLESIRATVRAGEAK
jgi:hypothetical protein